NPPTNVVTVAGPGHIVITWKDNSTTEDGFKIFRETVSEATVSTAAYQEVGTTQPDEERFVDEAVAAGVLYRYSVSAFNAHGSSVAVSHANPPLERGSLVFALNVLLSGAGSGKVTSVPS